MMKKVLKRFVLPVVLVSICLMAAALPQPTFGGGVPPSVTGKNQLVQALNAAYVRVLASGKWREYTAPYFPRGASNISDCYPWTEKAPFPATPVGVLKTILDTKQIRVGVYPESDPPVGTASDFSPKSKLIIADMLDELAKAYGLPPGSIKRVDVMVSPPGGSSLFTKLNNGDFDITDLTSSLGGATKAWPYQTEEQMRRYVARFTCTIAGGGQWLQVKEDSPYHTFEDVQSDLTTTLCAGSNSGQFSEAYFPGHTLDIQLDDANVCGQGVLNGVYTAYAYNGPTPVFPGLRSIDTLIYTGVSFWVAGDSDQDLDGIPDYTDNCPLNYNPDQADADGDEIGDVCDNCPATPNGPKAGSCTQGDIEKAGTPCTSNSDCGSDGFCSRNQEDTNRDGSGDACGPIAHIDIQPSTLNTDSKDQDAVVTIKVSPPAGYTADAIIPESVMIADIGGNTTNIAPLKWKIENGKSLQLKYNRSEILNVLRSYQLTGSVEMTITGRLTDNKLFIGSDRVTVKGK